MSSPADNFNEEQTRALLGEFRKLIGAGDDKFADTTLMRFLVAREMKPDKANLMLSKCLAWREKAKIDALPTPGLNGNSTLYAVRGYGPAVPDQNPDPTKANCPPEMLAFMKYMGGASFHKTDKEGRPLYLDRLGLYDTKAWATAAAPELWLDFHVRCNEMLYRPLMEESTKRTGKLVDKNTVIFDCSGMGWHQFHMPALNLLRLIAEHDQAYYPERLGMLFVVNAPSFFTKVWSIVKKWLDKRMLGKVHILGADYEQVLLKYIDAENLPSFLGGKCVCPHIEGGCCPSPYEKKALNRGGDYPYFVEIGSSDENAHFYEIHIPEMVDGQKKDMTLKWQFKSGKPVHFEVKYLEQGKVVLAGKHELPHSHSIENAEPGTYRLYWKKVTETGSFFGWGGDTTVTNLEYNVEIETNGTGFESADELEMLTEKLGDSRLE